MSDIFLETPYEPTQGSPKSTKTNPFFQLLYGLLFFLLLLASQVIVQTVMIFYFAYEKGLANQIAGIPLSAEELTNYAQAELYRNVNVYLITYGCLFALTVFLIFIIRRKNVWQETCILPFSAWLLPSLLMLGIGLLLFTNSILSLLPAQWIANYSESSSFITEGSLAGSLISQGLIAPITEELAFRGLMLSRFRKGVPLWIGIAISSILFGILHGELLWFIYAALLGTIFCVVAARTGSILTTILLHVIFNVAGTLLSYVRISFPPLAFIAFAVVGLLLIIPGMILLFKITGTPKKEVK